MTWKSTVAASGLMVIGTWLASYAPVSGPRPEPAAAPTAARTETAAVEIQREADRLHGRLQQAAAYRLPARNPFRFGSPRAPVPAPRHEPIATVENTIPADVPAAPTLRLALSGIAEDVVAEEGAAGQVIRTAIISSPDNVYLVKVGETLDDTYRVTAIAADAVELMRLDDGSTVRLTLRP